MSRYVTIMAVAAIVASGAGGCIRTVPLTSKLISKYDLSHDDLKRLQYYVSDDVIMQIEVSQSEAKRHGAGLKWRKDRFVHEVEIMENLPGIAEDISDNILGISFKAGSTFRFTLAADRDGKFYMTPDRVVDGNYIFEYNGQEYTTSSTSHVYLLVESKGLSEFRREREVLPGRRVPRDPD